MKSILLFAVIATSILAQAMPPPPPPPPKGTAKAEVQIHAQVWSYDKDGKYSGAMALNCDKKLDEVEYPVYDRYDSYPQTDFVVCEKVIDGKKFEILLGLVRSEGGDKENLQLRAIFRSEDSDKDYGSYNSNDEYLSVNVDDTKEMSLSLKFPHSMTSKKSGKKYSIDGSLYIKLAD